MQRLLVGLVLVLAAAWPAVGDVPPAPVIELVTAGKGGPACLGHAQEVVDLTYERCDQENVIE